MTDSAMPETAMAAEKLKIENLIINLPQKDGLIKVGSFLPPELQIIVLKYHVCNWARRIPSVGIFNGNNGSQHEKNDKWTNRCKLQLRQYYSGSSYAPIPWGWCCIPMTDNRPFPAPARASQHPNQHRRIAKIIAQQEADRAIAMRLYSTILNEDQMIIDPKYHEDIRKDFFKHLIVCFSTGEEFVQLFSINPTPINLEPCAEIEEGFWGRLKDVYGIERNRRKGPESVVCGRRQEPSRMSPSVMIPFPEKDLKNIRHISISLEDLGDRNRADAVLDALQLQVTRRDGNPFRDLVSIELDGKMGVGDFGSSPKWVDLEVKLDDLHLTMLALKLSLIRQQLPKLEVYLRGQGLSNRQYFGGDGSNLASFSSWYDGAGNMMTFRPVAFGYSREDVLAFCEGRVCSRSGPRSDGELGLRYAEDEWVGEWEVEMRERMSDFDLEMWHWQIRFAEKWEMACKS